MIDKQIKDLTELEIKLLRKHIIMFNDINIALPTTVFPHLDRNAVYRALLNLRQCGYYKQAGRGDAPFVFTNDGFKEARSYFLQGTRGLCTRWFIVLRMLKKFWLDHWRWIIGIAINLILGIIGLYIAWLQLRVPK